MTALALPDVVQTIEASELVHHLSAKRSGPPGTPSFMLAALTPGWLLFRRERVWGALKPGWSLQRLSDTEPSVRRRPSTGVGGGAR
jgi:hypothetical protein